MVGIQSPHNTQTSNSEQAFFKPLKSQYDNDYFIYYENKWNLNFLDRFSKNNKIPNFMNIRPLIADLFHANKRTYGKTVEQTDGHNKATNRSS
jgi:hypothetical protein